MLPVAFDDNSPFVLIGDNRQGHFLLLARDEWRNQPTPFEPLWAFECGDEPSMNAAAHWCAVRRVLWHGWGELAEKEGRQALAQHIDELMRAEPIGLVTSVIVQADAQPQVLNLGELVMTPAGSRKEIHYRHVFKTPAQRNRFFKWFFGNSNNGVVETLILRAIRQGTGSIAPLLDRIADGRPIDLTERKAA